MPEQLDPDGVVSLILMAQEGDSEAFGQLYDYYAPRVFRFLYAHLGERLDAEDLTGEVFFKVWQYLPAFEEKGVPFGGFLFKVARNVLIDHYRRSGRREQHKSLESSSDEADWVDHSQADPGESVPERLDSHRVYVLMAELKEEYRMVLQLRFLAELSPAETAQVLGKSSGTIRVLQHRALAALRKLMDGQE